MKQTDKVLKLLAKVSLSSAKKACGQASAFDFYQPKEPGQLMEKLKQRN